MSKHEIPLALVEPLTELFQMVLRVNREDFSAFLDFHGHISSVNISWHNGGWNRDRPTANERRTVYLDSDDADESLLSVRKELEAASYSNEAMKSEAAREADEAERAKYAELRAKFGDAA